MPTEPAPLTLSQVVHRAVEVCDPPGTDTDLADFFVRFEDADEPVSALEDVEQRMNEAAGAAEGANTGAAGDVTGMDGAGGIACGTNGCWADG